ncbi:hypothetical protein NA57DRAFT_62092 [Rhizodiscina lignyota]|uniref:Uncharacterized protein n=1 Tax=Rhizodiscina lignyota TaxID=1504668 RepID=A0A9P4I648_9PEZI|nr:hypothetical protein NA57DRAFT_62092 [Rhizodiscina lignyota]
MSDTEDSESEDLAYEEWLEEKSKEGQEHLYTTIPMFLMTASVAYMVPCLCYSTCQMIIFFIRQMMAGVRDMMLIRNNQDGNSPPCSHLYPSPAHVFLVSSDISLLDSSHLSGGKDASTQIPLAERSELPFAHLTARTVASTHWAIVIRGITYELLRQKGSRKIELKITQADVAATVDALGIPLNAQTVIELGVTFLSNEDITDLMDAEEESRNHFQFTTYDPIGNNCQNLWGDRLLQFIVCQCPDQRALKIPGRAHQMFSSPKAAAGAHRFSALLLALQKRTFIPWPRPWTAASNIWIHLLMEAAKYWLLWTTWTEDGVQMIRSGLPREVYFTAIASEVENKTRNKDTKGRPFKGHMGKYNLKEKLKRLKKEYLYLDEDEAERRRIIMRFMHIAIFLAVLDTVVGSLHKFTPYGTWEWLDFGLGFVVDIAVDRLARHLGKRKEMGVCKAKIWQNRGKSRKSAS